VPPDPGLLHVDHHTRLVHLRRDVERAAPGHRVERVLDDVGECARDQRAIDEHDRQRRGDVVVDVDPAGEPGAVRLDDVVDQLHGIGGGGAGGGGGGAKGG